MEDSYKKIDNYYYKSSSKPLGRGAFATVYIAHDETKDGKEVAVKVIPTANLLGSQENYELFMREIEVLRQIKGDNIVHLLDVKRTQNNLYIFTDYCNGGDLDAYLRKNGPMPEEKALQFMYQLSKAFNTINSLEIKNPSGRKVVIMHRDIKTANILFHDGHVQVADFGFAKMIDEAVDDVKMAHTLLGTPLYMAPQILNDEPYTAKCDIWSSGLVFYETLFGKLPWNGTSMTNLYKNICQKPLNFPKSLLPETKDLIEKMLQIDESKRISWKEVEDHPAMRGVEKKYAFSKPTIPQASIQTDLSPLKSEHVNTTSPLAHGTLNSYHGGYNVGFPFQQQNYNNQSYNQHGHQSDYSYQQQYPIYRNTQQKK